LGSNLFAGGCFSFSIAIIASHHLFFDLAFICKAVAWFIVHGVFAYMPSWVGWLWLICLFVVIVYVVDAGLPMVICIFEMDRQHWRGNKASAVSSQHIGFSCLASNDVSVLLAFDCRGISSFVFHFSSSPLVALPGVGWVVGGGFGSLGY